MECACQLTTQAERPGARDSPIATATPFRVSLRCRVRLHRPKRAISGEVELDHRSRIPDDGLRRATGLWAGSATPAALGRWGLLLSRPLPESTRDPKAVRCRAQPPQWQGHKWKAPLRQEKRMAARHAVKVSTSTWRDRHPCGLGNRLKQLPPREM